MSTRTTGTLAMVTSLLGLALSGGAPAAAGALGDARIAAAPTSGLTQAQNQSVRVSTLVITVEKVERATRGLVGRDPNGMLLAVTVAPDVALYDELAEGDLIVVDYIDAVVVEMTPGAVLTGVDDTTARAKAEVVDPSVKIEQQLKQVVTIDEVDESVGSVVYHGKEGRRVLRAVQDPALLRGLRPGDVITITLTREKALSVRRAPK